MGGGPRVVVSTAAFCARVRGSVPGFGGLKETIWLFLPHPRVKVSIVRSLRDREVACSASDRQGSNFESCVWSTVSSQSSHHPQEVLLAQFSLYVHKGGLKPYSFHFHFDHVYKMIIWEVGHCLQRWPNIGPTLIQPIVFAVGRSSPIQSIGVRWFRTSTISYWWFRTLIGDFGRWFQTVCGEFGPRGEFGRWFRTVCGELARPTEYSLISLFRS